MADIKNNVIMSEAEKQEKAIRDEYNAKKRKKRIKKLITWVIVLILICVGLTYYNKVKKDFEDKAKAMIGAVTTVEVPVEENVYTSVIDLSGYVEAYDTQESKFRSTGAVTGVYVKEGDSVTKGQLLASIDNTSQTYQVKNIQNQIKQAELSGSVSQLETLKLQLKNAENNLEYTNLVANFDGTVATVSVSEGDYFEAGSKVMTIVDVSKLKATVQIDEIDMAKVSLGQKAYLTFDSLPGETVEAVVTYIPMLATYTNQGIGVVSVELTIENPPASLKPGYSFEGTIQVEGDVQMLLIPQAAITTGRGGVTTVEKKNADGTTETVNVRVKYLGEGYCQLLSGDIKKGDILTYTKSGANMMMMGMPGGNQGGR
ncbi:MAG: efflux RND transporter periplasmic adaptor subunit [Spirochaetales bacterium]|nr:efflux RND transporter periplasmic adaptor subunit [Spirochaetales bacterium]